MGEMVLQVKHGRMAIGSPSNVIMSRGGGGLDKTYTDIHICSELGLSSRASAATLTANYV